MKRDYDLTRRDERESYIKSGKEERVKNDRQGKQTQ